MFVFCTKYATQDRSKPKDNPKRLRSQCRKQPITGHNHTLGTIYRSAYQIFLDREIKPGFTKVLTQSQI